MDVEGGQPYVDQRSAQRYLTVLLERVEDMFEYVKHRPGGSRITIIESKEVHSCSFCKCFSSWLFSKFLTLSLVFLRTLFFASSICRCTLKITKQKVFMKNGNFVQHMY